MRFGDGDLEVNLFVRFKRMFTASESSSSSSDDSEPDNESSSPDTMLKRRITRWAGEHTIDKIGKGGFCYSLSPVQPCLDIVPMPIGPEVNPLFVEVKKYNPLADIACSWT